MSEFEQPTASRIPLDLIQKIGTDSLTALIAVIRNRAHQSVFHALRTGDLQAPATCEACGRTGRKLEAHHANYFKPHDLRWLCLKCHRDLHRALRNDVARQIVDGRTANLKPGGRQRTALNEWRERRRAAGLPAGGPGARKQEAVSA